MGGLLDVGLSSRLRIEHHERVVVLKSHAVVVALRAGRRNGVVQRHEVPLRQVHRLTGKPQLALVLDAVVGTIAGNDIVGVLVGLVERIIPHPTGNSGARNLHEARIPVIQTGRIAHVVDGREGIAMLIEQQFSGTVIHLGLVLGLLIQVMAIIGLVLIVDAVLAIVDSLGDIVLLLRRLVDGPQCGIAVLEALEARHVGIGGERPLAVGQNGGVGANRSIGLAHPAVVELTIGFVALRIGGKHHVVFLIGLEQFRQLVRLVTVPRTSVDLARHRRSGRLEIVIRKAQNTRVLLEERAPGLNEPGVVLLVGSTVARRRGRQLGAVRRGHGLGLGDNSRRERAHGIPHARQALFHFIGGGVLFGLGHARNGRTGHDEIHQSTGILLIACRRHLADNSAVRRREGRLEGDRVQLQTLGRQSGLDGARVGLAHVVVHYDIRVVVGLLDRYILFLNRIVDPCDLRHVVALDGCLALQHRHDAAIGDGGREIALHLVGDGVGLHLALGARLDEHLMGHRLVGVDAVARIHRHRGAGRQGDALEDEHIAEIRIGLHLGGHYLTARGARSAGGVPHRLALLAAVRIRIGDGDHLGRFRLVAIGHGVVQGVALVLLQLAEGRVIARGGQLTDGGHHEVLVVEGARLGLATQLVEVIGHRGTAIDAAAVSVLAVALATSVGSLGEHGRALGLAHEVGVGIHGRTAVLRGVTLGDSVIVAQIGEILFVDAQAVPGQALGLVVVIDLAGIARVDDVARHIAEQVRARHSTVTSPCFAQRTTGIQLPLVILGVGDFPHLGMFEVGVVVGVGRVVALGLGLVRGLLAGVGQIHRHRGAVGLGHFVHELVDRVSRRRVVPRLHLDFNTAAVRALADTLLGILLQAVVVGVVPHIVANIALGAVHIAEREVVVALVSAPLVARIVVDGLAGIGAGLLQRNDGVDRIAARRTGHVAQVIVANQLIGIVVGEALCVVLERIVGPGGQRRLDETVRLGIGGAEDIGLARTQAEAEEAVLARDNRCGLAVGVTRDGAGNRTGLGIVFIRVDANAREALLAHRSDLIGGRVDDEARGAAHLLDDVRGLALLNRASTHGVHERVDELVVFHGAIGQHVVAEREALEGHALGDAQLVAGHLGVVGTMDRIRQLVVSGLGYLCRIVLDGLDIDVVGGDDESGRLAGLLVRLATLHGDIGLRRGVGGAVAIPTDLGRGRRIVVVLVREGVTQAIGARRQVREHEVAGVAVVVALGGVGVRSAGIGQAVAAPAVALRLAGARVALDPLRDEVGVAIAHELDALTVAVDRIAVGVQQLHLDAVQARILFLEIVIEIDEVGGAVLFLGIVEGDPLGRLAAQQATSVGALLIGSVLLALHTAGRIVGDAVPIGVEVHVITEVTALVGRIDEGTGLDGLLGSDLGRVHVDAHEEGVPLQHLAHLVGAHHVLLVGIAGVLVPPEVGFAVLVHMHLQIDCRIAVLGTQELGQVQRRLHLVVQAHVAHAHDIGGVQRLGPDGPQVVHQLVGAGRVVGDVLLQLGERDEALGALELLGGQRVFLIDVAGFVVDDAAGAELLDGLQALLRIVGEVGPVLIGRHRVDLIALAVRRHDDVISPLRPAILVGPGQRVALILEEDSGFREAVLAIGVADVDVVLVDRVRGAALLVLFQVVKPQQIINRRIAHMGHAVARLGGIGADPNLHLGTCFRLTGIRIESSVLQHATIGGHGRLVGRELANLDGIQIADPAVPG